MTDHDLAHDVFRRPMRLQDVDVVDGKERLYAAILRAPTSRGRILEFELPKDLSARGIHFLAARHLSGGNELPGDRPLLADKAIRYRHEPVGLIAGACKNEVALAREAISVKVQSRIPVESISDALNGRNIIHGEDNVYVSFEHGANEDRSSDREGLEVFEATYSIAHRVRLALETRSALAESDGDKVVVHSSDGCSRQLGEGIAKALGVDASLVRHVPLRQGQGFCSYDDTLPILASAGALSRAFKKPIKLILDRDEELLSSPKSPPSEVQVRAEYDQQGRIHSLRIDAAFDAGAYLLCAEDLKELEQEPAPGPYDGLITGLRVRLFATNTAPNAEAHFGQSALQFALERSLDQIAARLHMAPATLRRANFSSAWSAFDPCALEMLARGDDSSLYQLDPLDEEPGRGSAMAYGWRGPECLVASRVVCRLDPLTDAPRIESLTVLIPEGSELSRAEAAAAKAVARAFFQELHLSYGAIVNVRIGQLCAPGAADIPAVEVLTVPRSQPVAQADLLFAIESAVTSALISALGHTLGVELCALPVPPREVGFQRGKKKRARK
ncbi:MAG: molybdopterin cofactor-binding domain-containing protein [Planctomycetota bacterium]